MFENFFGRRSYKHRLRQNRKRINNSMTDDEAFCYLGRYPKIAKSVGRYNLYSGKVNWYSIGRHRNLDKSCPYLIPETTFKTREASYHTNKQKLKDIVSERNRIGKDYRSKKEAIKELNNNINEYEYAIHDKEYTVPKFDINTLFVENEGFSNYIIEGLTGAPAAIDDLATVLQNATNAVNGQNTQLSAIEKSVSFLEQVIDDTKNTVLTIDEIQRSSNNETENKMHEVEKQNADIDKIIIENTQNNAYINYKKGLYLQDDSANMKQFNQYYLFWIYFILFIITAFLFVSKTSKENTFKTYIFVFILAIYPFVIGMVEKFGYTILYQIYDFFNFNIYNKT